MGWHTKHSSKAVQDVITTELLWKSILHLAVPDSAAGIFLLTLWANDRIENVKFD